VTVIKDIGWLVLIVVCLPLLMAVGLIGLVVVLVRHVYWWSRGNTTAVSRHRTRPLSKSARRSFLSGGWRSARPGPTTQAPPAARPDAPVPEPVK